MTDNEKPIELTESQILFQHDETGQPTLVIKLSYKTEDYTDLDPRYVKFKQLGEQVKKQILTALHEYAKLKEYQKKLDLKFRNDVIETIQLRDYVKQLKEENEELLIENNKLSNEIQDNYRVFDETESLKQEINQLKQLKQRIEEYLSDKKKHVYIDDPEGYHQMDIVDDVREQLHQLLKD